MNKKIIMGIIILIVILILIYLYISGFFAGAGITPSSIPTPPPLPE